MISEKASFSIRMSTEQKGWVRSLMTMYSTTPSISHTRAAVISTARRRLNSSENTSVVRMMSTLNPKATGRLPMKANSRAGDSPRFKSSTTSASPSAIAGRTIIRRRSGVVSYTVLRCTL